MSARWWTRTAGYSSSCMGALKPILPGSMPMSSKSLNQHLSERCAHRLQRSLEGIENQAEDFQRNHPKQGFVPGLSENDGGMSISLGQRDMAFGNGALDLGAVGQSKAHFSLWL